MSKCRRYTIKQHFELVLDPRFRIGTPGSSECQYGYSPIRKKSVCNEARQQLEITGWNGADKSDSEYRLPYCWIGAGGNANFNPKGDSGNPPNIKLIASLICENSRK